MTVDLAQLHCSAHQNARLAAAVLYAVYAPFVPWRTYNVRFALQLFAFLHRARAGVL